MKIKTKIVIVEDHTILREGLRSLLSAQDGLEVIGEAADGLEAIRCVGNLKPDFVLIDLSMPRMNGNAAIREIKRQFPQTKMLALTVHKTEEFILETFRAGADGYCLKDATHSELLLAIESIRSGKPYVSPGISDKLLKGYLERKAGKDGGSLLDILTSREKEILKLIAEGYKNREISRYLSISIKTVEKHRSNVMQKLDLHNASSLTAYAIEKGLVMR